MVSLQKDLRQVAFTMNWRLALQEKQSTRIATLQECIYSLRMEFKKAITFPVSAFLILFVFLNRSQAIPIPEKLTIRGAAELALEHNPMIQKAHKKVEENAAQVSLVRSALIPNVSASLTGNHKKDATNSPAFRFGGDPYNQYVFDFKITEGVGFYTRDRFRMAEREQTLSQIDLELASRELYGKVISAFYKVILDQKNLETLNQTQTIERESLLTAQKRYKIGRGQLLDVLQVKTQLALLAPKIAQAQNQIQIDASTLANLLGSPEIPELQLSGDLIIIPYPRLQRRIDQMPHRFPELEKVAIKQSQLQSERNVTWAKNLPNLSAAFDLMSTSYTKNDLFNNSATSWSLGLQLSIPIFSGLSSIHEKRTYASRQTQLELEQQNVRNNLSLQQTQSAKNLLVAWQTISSAWDALNIADESLNEAKNNYQFVIIDFLQFLSVQQAYLEARSSLFLAEYQYITSLVSHFVASGASLDELIHLLEEKAS